MTTGITVKITWRTEVRERRSDKHSLYVWTGITMGLQDCAPSLSKSAYLSGYNPRKVSLEIICPPPGVLPRCALGYPRFLPLLKWANDNSPRMSIRGRRNAHKIMVVDAKSVPPANPVIVTSISRSCSDLKADFLEETLLRRLSRQFQRHIFVHDNGRYGYIDETLRFIPVDADGPMTPQQL